MYVCVCIMGRVWRRRRRRGVTGGGGGRVDFLPPNLLAVHVWLLIFFLPLFIKGGSFVFEKSSCLLHYLLSAM